MNMRRKEMKSWQNKIEPWRKTLLQWLEKLKSCVLNKQVLTGGVRISCFTYSLTHEPLYSLSLTHTGRSIELRLKVETLGQTLKTLFVSLTFIVYPGAGGYGLLNGSPETRYPGPYGDVYGPGPWGSYDKRGGPPRR